MCTIESVEDYVDRIQEAIDDLLLPILFGQTEPLPSDMRQLVTLTPAQGGLDVPDLRFEAPQQFAASTTTTASYEGSITTQSRFAVAGEKSTEELKRQHQALKTASVKSRMESIDSTLPSDLLRSVNQSNIWSTNACKLRNAISIALRISPGSKGKLFISNFNVIKTLKEFDISCHVTR